MIQSSHFLVLMVWISCGVFAIPQYGPSSAARDLRHTFNNEGEIPGGFFDGTIERSPTRYGSAEGERKVYPACRDGSGGMCIPAGQCSPDLKAPGTPGREACGAEQECCYGGPVNSKTPCGDKGGECTAPPRSCGKGPQITSGTECDHAKGEICCIWTF